MVAPLLLALIDPISRIIDKIIPDPEAAARAKIEMLKTENQQMLQELQLALQADQMQADINQTEAASENVFVSGWRPFIGWICGCAFAYHYVLQPFFAFFLASVGHPVSLPDFEMGELTTVLLGMLGLGSLRTVEKVKFGGNLR